MTKHLYDRFPLFKDLPPEFRDTFAEQVTVSELPPGEMLMEEGHAGDYVVFILDGEVEIIKALGSPDERHIAIRRHGDFIGELSVINPDGKHMASVRTKTDVQVLKLNGEEFNHLIINAPKIAYEIIKVLSARLTDAHNNIIRDLQEKNERLTVAYAELQAAQAELIEKERIERELAVAHEIQMSVVPEQLPTLEGYEIGGMLHTAREVGGDFYDVIPIDRDHVAVMIGDVTDKGVPAAMFMSRAHAFLRAEILQSRSPVTVLENVNRHLLRISGSSFPITVLLGILDKSKGSLHYARAGHEFPLLASPHEAAVSLPYDPGQPLGFFDEPLIDEQRVSLPSGSSLLLFTDGVTDARNEEGEYFGMQRFIELVNGAKDWGAQAMCDEIWRALDEFQGQSDRDDDVTLLIVRSEV